MGKRGNNTARQERGLQGEEDVEFSCVRKGKGGESGGTDYVSPTKKREKRKNTFLHDLKSRGRLVKMKEDSSDSIDT